MKKILCVLLTVLVLSQTAFAAGTFSDVEEGNWAYDYIERAYAEGVVQGIGDGKYDPTSPLTYAQFVTVIARKYFSDELKAAYRYPEFLKLGGTEKQYDDWWYAAWSVYCGEELLGSRRVSVSDFASAPIPRQDMALVLYNTAKKLIRKDVAAGSANVPDIASVNAAKNLDASQTDAEKVPAMNEEIKTAVRFCYSAGIINGVDAKGNFAPLDSVTRAQLAAIYCRTADIMPELIKDAEKTDGDGEEEIVNADDPDVLYILEKTNEVRASLDRRELVLDPGLMKAAEQRAKELAESFSHNRPDGSHWTDAIPDGVNYTASAENIAEAPSAAAAVEAWLESEGHRVNIENARYGKTGIGVYGNYFVQIFTDKPYETE